MRKAFLTALMLLLSVVAYAGDGWEAGSQYNQLYNTNTVQTFVGEVVSVDREARLMPGMSPAVVASLKTENGQVTVHIGPRWFTKHYRPEWNLEVGDRVEVVGSVITFQGEQAVMAASGHKGDLALTIRSSSGDPVWDTKREDF